VSDSIHYRPGIARDLARLPAHVLDRIDKAILSLETDPRKPGTIKLAGASGMYRMRVGDYRVVYEIDDVSKRVDVRLSLIGETSSADFKAALARRRNSSCIGYRRAPTIISGAIMQTIQPLECRRLLSAASVSVTSKGTLIIAGTPAADQVTITRTNPDDPNSALDIAITGGSSSAAAKHVHKKVSQFQRISIDLGAGADTVSFVIPGKLKQPTTVLGGAGDDTLEAILPGRSVISGGEGNDALFSQTTTINATVARNSDVVVQTLAAKNKTGLATLLGNAGNDTLFADSNDSVDGGAGSDVAAAQMSNLSTDNQARADALAAVFYGRLGATNIEIFQGQIGGTNGNASGNGNLPAPPTQPGLFAPGAPAPTNPSPLDPNPPSSPIDFPSSSPIDGLFG
jgi:mRNA interferase RelE/StbE